MLAYININYADPICLTYLAGLAEVHPSHLSREFKRQIGRTPLEYVLRLRVHRACTLLIESKKSIKEIGMSVGYKRPEAFSKAFKRIRGCSPRHFRASGLNEGGHAGKSQNTT